jgi:hypothetical protein
MAKEKQMPVTQPDGSINMNDDHPPPCDLPARVVAERADLPPDEKQRINASDLLTPEVMAFIKADQESRPREPGYAPIYDRQHPPPWATEQWAEQWDANLVAANAAGHQGEEVAKK